MNKSYRVSPSSSRQFLRLIRKQDLGNDVGKQLDAAARRLNDRTADSNGKKAE